MADILLVDEQAADRGSIAAVLRSAGHRVLEADNGEAGLALVRTGRPDVVITETALPGLDGYEFVRALRADPAIAPTAVVFHTAPLLPEEVRPKAAALGVRDVLPKPGVPEEILRVIDAALEDRPVTGPSPAPVSDREREHIWALGTRLVEKVLELEATQAALVESEARFRSMAESAPVGIVAAEGPGAWTYANRRFAEICGLPDDDRLSRAYTEVLHPEDLPWVSEVISSARVAGQQGHFRARILRPGGDLRWVDVEWAPVGPAADEAGFIATVQDVTELVLAAAQQEALDARLRVSERLEGLGQLAGGIAHDFNNLLAVILNYAEFVGEALAGDDPSAIPLKRVREDMAEISLAARRAAALTHELLIFGRREVVRPEVMDPAAAMDSVGALLRRTIGEHVTLEIKVAEGVWPLRVDPSRFQQVLVNLVVNARDALADTGTVMVAVDNLDIDGSTAELHGLARGGRYVRMEVADTGSGMAPDVVARAFEPFFTTKGPGRGTGLGLATVYGITRQWNGSVAIYSEPGQGTAVRVYVPIAENAEGEVDEQAAPEPPPSAGHGELVLVVEDEAAVLAITRRLLEEAGYKVASARSGPAALELLARLDPLPDVLLSDVVMPQMSGLQLTKRAVAQYPGIGVVFMSGYPQGLVPRHGAVPSATALVEKPFTRQSLLAAVGAAVARRAP